MSPACMWYYFSFTLQYSLDTSFTRIWRRKNVSEMRKRNFDSRRKRSKSLQCGGEGEEIEGGPGLYMACYWLQGLDTHWLAFVQKWKSDEALQWNNNLGYMGWIWCSNLTWAVRNVLMKTVTEVYQSWQGPTNLDNVFRVFSYHIFLYISFTCFVHVSTI